MPGTALTPSLGRLFQLSFFRAPLSSERYYYLALGLTFAGLMIRIAWQIHDPSLWFDEIVVVLNVLNLNYRELLGPLMNAGNGSPFFLWSEKLVVSLLGDTPWVWRLPAFLAGCFSLFVFLDVAKRVLPGKGLLWAVGLYAFSDRLVWHTVEVKPYAIDACVAVGMLALWLRTEAWQPLKKILLFACVCPLAVCLSFPAMFACIGPGLLLLLDAWRSRRIQALLAYGLFAGLLAATCLWLIKGPIHYQQIGMQAAGWGWTHEMPDLSDPLRACWWPFSACFEVLRYCFAPTGGFLCGFAVLGTVLVLRNRENRLAVLLLGPIVGLVAAAYLQRYPCGCDRPITFLIPTVSLLLGIAIPTVLQWLQRSRASDERGMVKPPARWMRASLQVARLATILLLLSPMVTCLYHIVVPWHRYDCRGATGYILAHREPGDLVIVNSWDQLYFFRDLDRSCWRTREWMESGEGQRCWVTINLVFEDCDPPEKNMISKTSWKVVQRKQFDLLMVLLLERVEP